MELHRAEWLGLVADTLVGTVIHIYKPWLPIASESCRVYSISVILRSDETSVCSDHANRLIMTSVTIFQFICGRTCSPGHQLVTHTDSENRLILSHGLADILDCLRAEFRVAGTIGNEQSVIIYIQEIIVPWNADELHATIHETSQYIMLDTAVHKNDFLVS